MQRIDILIKTFVTSFGGFCGYFLGGWDTLLEILVILSVVDYITGILVAGYHGSLKSEIGFRGISKKVMLFLIVGVTARLDVAIGSNSTIREAAIFFFIGNELLSILENAGRMGIKLPDILNNAIEILGRKASKGVDK
ncbi:phage holin family protein [Bacillus thuringiensis]|nr:phage holin family protein [Bacillus thuringiensis]